MIIALAGWGLARVPTGFLPIEDQGYLLVTRPLVQQMLADAKERGAGFNASSRLPTKKRRLVRYTVDLGAIGRRFRQRKGLSFVKASGDLRFDVCRVVARNSLETSVR